VIFDLGFESGTLISTVITSQSYSFSVYILTWGGTIMILRHNIQRIGKVKFWILVLLPIVGFMSYFVTLYQVLYPESTVTQALSENFAIPIILGSAAVSALGIFFGWGFCQLLDRLAPLVISRTICSLRGAVSCSSLLRVAQWSYKQHIHRLGFRMFLWLDCQHI
jgi:hypothetical protein